jgi:hypothetical protein
MKGVSHYKKDGTLYSGSGTHKDSKGQLMSGKTHTKSSVNLYHFKELSKSVQQNIKSKKK